MSAKVYVLLDIADNHYREIVNALRGEFGITNFELLEGPPDLMLTIEAPNREKLAEFTVRALSQLETMTEKVNLLPVQNGSGVYV
jgi:DNA-binding Lrp family transcriptional regulator